MKSHRASILEHDAALVHDAAQPHETIQIRFRKHPTTYLVILAAVIVLLGILMPAKAKGDPIVLAANDPTFTVSKGKLTTELKGSGYTKNSEVNIEVLDPDTGVNVPIGSGTTDGSGNFDMEWPNTLSTAAVIGGTVTVTQGTTTVTATVTKDTGFFGWVLELLLSDAGPLRTDYSNTELADAGFTGTVDLIGVSPNADIVSETTTFDAATNSITTIGFFEALAVGPVIGTYQAVGTFTNLSDPVTGDLITGPLTLTDSSDPIGVIVPEPATFWLQLTVVAGQLAAGCARRHRRLKA
jgi:hypothetical protein